MIKPVKDKEAIETVLSRGVAAIYPTAGYVKSLLESGKRLTVYLGIDPTGPKLHLGHAIPLRKLAQLQKLGHKIILLIGDFTAMSGDPDKTEARKRLTRKEILANCKTYKKQASRILSFSGANAAVYRFNSEWYAKMSFQDAIDLAASETVQRMLERDLFERRMKSGKALYIHEFMYPLMQGYDSVALAVDGEVGGSDQTFNMLTGRDLVKARLKKEKFVLTMKLLEDPTGKKMGKTEGNMVTLDDEPNDMFGKIMSWPDGMLPLAFELLTDVPLNEIRKRGEAMEGGLLNPRDMKAELARLIVTAFHSKKDADVSEKRFVDTFKKKETPGGIPEVSLQKFSSFAGFFADKLCATGLASSKSEARRLLQEGAVKVNGSKIVFTDHTLSVSLKKGDVIQVGKRKFLKIV